jgi:hypothetical protein
MDLSNLELHCIGFISTAPDTFNRAKAVIALAESNEEMRQTLVGCGVVLLAAALEQAVHTLLSHSAETKAFLDDTEFSSTRAALYLDKQRANAATRVRSLPQVLTNRRFRLDPKHEISRTLEDLIETRNSLVHINEEALHSIGPNEVKIEDDKIIATHSQALSPWLCIRLETVKVFQAAVEIYFDEVLFPPSGEITEGTIIQINPINSLK